jgi:uncharacterized protein (DUF1330 family)
MPAYVVFTRTKTIDQKELEEYWAGIRATMKGHPIEVLVAYGKHEVLEGDPIEGIVIAKFPNVKAAKDWYFSEAYQSVAQHRKRGAIYHGLVVEVSADHLESDRGWSNRFLNLGHAARIGNEVNT